MCHHARVVYPMIFLFQVVTAPFPFQSLMKLLLVTVTSGLLLYASPGIVAAVLPRPLRVDDLMLSLLVTMAMSVLIPLLFRLVSDVNVVMVIP